ncbi:MAG: sel1 repeat family protein [Verrucomicrobiales bacterium]|nr:sel1 repeat family protein [Verrucomicrobiales bacterium]
MRHGILREDAQLYEKLKREYNRKKTPILGIVLGDIYLHGLGTGTNRAEAEKLFRRQATDGNRTAQNKLAALLNSGDDAEKKLSEIERLYRQAAGQKHPTATANLGHLLRKRTADSNAVAEGNAFLRAAAAMSHSKACYSLGRALLLGDRIPKDVEIGTKYLIRAAELGNQEALSELLAPIHSGLPTTNPNEVIYWRVVEHAAKGGNPVAKYLRWARSFKNGNAILDDDLRDAAENEIVLAQYNLAVYFEDSGEFQKAAKWYEKAALQAYAEAAFNFALLLDIGKGVSKDSAAALQWTYWAAVQGHANSQHQICVAFTHGKHGFEKDLCRGMAWCERAALQGYGPAARQLAEALEKGDLCFETDKVHAYKWLLIAQKDQSRMEPSFRKHHEQLLSEGKRRLEAELPLPDLEFARKIAEHFKPRIEKPACFD